MDTKNQQSKPFLQIIKIVTEHFAWIAFGVYASGFCLWNYYLSNFGFFEYNIIQARFLSAGLLLSVPIALTIVVTEFILRKFSEKYSRWKEFISNFSAICIGFWISFLPMYLFPRVPQYLGGGKPISTSLIGNPSQIKFLSNFDVPSAQNGNSESVQTFPVCLIYQDDQYVVFFNITPSNVATSSGGKINMEFKSRVISLSKDEYLGFQTIPGDYADFQCNVAVNTYNR